MPAPRPRIWLNFLLSQIHPDPHLRLGFARPSTTRLHRNPLLPKDNQVGQGNLTFLSLGTHLGPLSHHEQGAGVHPTPSPPVGRGPSERWRPPPEGSSSRPHCQSARQLGRAQASAFCASPLLGGHCTQPWGDPSSGLCPAA